METDLESDLETEMNTGPLERQRGDEPDALPPELLCENDSPHCILTIVRELVCRWASRSEFSFVADDFAVHASLHHAEEHCLNGAIELMICRVDIGGTNIR